MSKSFEQHPQPTHVKTDNLNAIVASIATLDNKIRALQNAPGTRSPEDKTALDNIAAASALLKTKADDANGTSL